MNGKTKRFKIKKYVLQIFEIHIFFYYIEKHQNR